VLRAVKTIQKQVFNTTGTEFSGRQADVVDHQQINCHTVRARIEIRAGTVSGRYQPAIMNLHHGLPTPPAGHRPGRAQQPDPLVLHRKGQRIAFVFKTLARIEHGKHIQARLRDSGD